MNPTFLPLQLAHDEATRCIQCGFCLPACPTYKVFGEEKHSPRGRIQLVKAWAEDNIDVNADLLAALDLCLDCRACETACPIDVQYGRILTGARDALNDMAAGRPAKPVVQDQPSRSRPAPKASTKTGHGAAFRWTLRHVAAKPKRLRVVTRIARRALHSPPGRWVRRRAQNRPDSWLASALTFAEGLPGSTKSGSDSGSDSVSSRGTAASGAPTVSAELASSGAPTVSSAPTHSGILGSPAIVDDSASPAEAGPLGSETSPSSPVTVFLGCAQEGMFPETNDATVDLLEKAGFDVAVPREQVCCGALHRHHGDKEFARTLLLRNLHVFGAFDDSRDDVIVMNAGGCMAWLKEAAELFEPNTEEHRAAERLAARVRDVSEMIYVADGSQGGQPGNTHATDFGKRGLRVVYQPSCHLTNVCGISAEPLEVLDRITGGCAAMPPDGGSCCGSAGIYNALHPQASRAILDAKMEGIAADPPDVIVTSNPGCHLQMLAGVAAHKLDDKVRVMQWADFVNEYGSPPRAPKVSAIMNDSGSSNPSNPADPSNPANPSNPSNPADPANPSNPANE